MPVALVIPPVIDDAAPTGITQLARESAAAGKAPQLQVLVSPGAEGAVGADTRRFTLQVTNRKGRSCLGLFALLVVIGTSATGGPAGTQTVTVSTGATVQTIAANQAIILFTDAAGKAVVDVQVTGAGSRYVRAGVLGAVFGTDPTAWA